MQQIWQYLLLGLAVGPAYVLTAQGMVVAHRGSGVVNFGSAAIGLVGAYVYYDTQPALPPGLAAACGVAVAAAAAAVQYWLVMRYLERASQLTRVMATLGVAIIGQSILSLILQVNSVYPTEVIGQDNVTILGASTTTYALAVLGVAVASTVVLWAVYRWTAFGLKTAAVAENQRAAASLGRSPEAIGLLNWTLGGALAGMGAILVVPITGISAGLVMLILVPALAAGLLGSFTSFWLTLLGGLVVGIAESELTRFSIGTGWPDNVGFLLITLVLVFRGTGLPARGVLQPRLPPLGTGRVRPWLVLTGVGVGVALCYVLSGAGAAALATTFGTAIVLLSSIVVTGYAGQVSLAQLGLAGIAAFAAARLAESYGLTMWEAAPIGVITTLPVGLIVGLPALRARGLNLAIVTLGLGLLVQTVVLDNANFTGGIYGTVVQPPSLFGLSLNAELYPARYAILCLILFALCALMVANLRRGRVGLHLIAVRGNERAAATLGINVVATKLYAFVVGAGIAGLGGVVLAYETTNVLFSQFNVTSSISLLGFVVIGGIGFVGGSLAGAVAAAGGLFSWILGTIISGPTVGSWLALAGGIGLPLALLKLPTGIAGDNVEKTRPLFARLDRARPAQGPQPMLGRPTADATSRRLPDRLLEVEHVGKRFGGVVALDDVSLAVGSGHIHGLIGPNGAGKTTLIDLVSGVTRGYSGRIALDGKSIDAYGPSRRARLGVGRTFQGLELFDDLTVESNLRVGADAPRARDYVGELVWPRRRPLPETAVAAVRELELNDVLNKSPDELPFGQRRLVAIARAIAARPSILLLDEPAAGLDDRESRELAVLLRRLADEWNFAILLVEHDMNLVLTACDSITALDFGSTIAAGTPSAVRNDPAVIAAYLGTTSWDSHSATSAVASP